MLRAAFSFLLSLFKSYTQLHLEVLFLREQLEIVARLPGACLPAGRPGRVLTKTEFHAHGQGLPGPPH
jgi:hypothetical protein